MKGEIQKHNCTSMGAFSFALQSLNNRGFVNVCHHSPSALSPNEYIICTHQGCRTCANTTGLSVIWREDQQSHSTSAVSV